MKIINYQDVESLASELVGIKDAQGLGVRPLIGKRDGAQLFSMSVLELEAGGNTPEHAHEREEQLFVISGSGEIKAVGGTHELESGHAVFIPSDEVHQVTNPTSRPLVVLVVTH
ncbi:MAG: cupin domain-containing protein [Pseudomonadales bacterium]|jgi:quercetin dioxygenase-like cupin family protein|nr:cupin domain-containing protein [Pseudomonadales bacterium]HJN49867.1 cupin domain-containing protein [Pseudomonadales bacterium]|tara:strand:- start:25 stop:366 length:342 start_codon:yes stop_codon:yes gene_type:complete